MLAIYKKSQGYWTRMLTMLGGALVVVVGAGVLFTGPLVTLRNWLQQSRGMNFGPALMIQWLFTVVFLLVGGYIAFWVSYLRPGTGDFFIATEGEMKKVSWSTRKEILGSTQVVVFTLLAMGALLFVVDLAFMLLFSWWGVLPKEFIELLIGGKS